MTILPKKTKVQATATTSSSSATTTTSSTGATSSTSPSSDSGGNVPLTNSESRKRPCTDRASTENIAHSSTSGDSNPVPSSSKRRHTTSTSSERRLHHHHLLHLHHSNLSSAKKVATATHQASPVQLTNYTDTSLEVQENTTKVPSSTHTCCPNTCEPSQASSSTSTATTNGGLAIDTNMVSSEASNNQMPSPPPASPTGYNSGDEYGDKSNCNSRHCTPEQVTEMERRFEKKLRKKGLTIMKMGEDGACLFRAVADQVYGDEEMHSLVRKLCCDYMIKNSDYFSQYVTEDFNQYVNRKRRDHIQGNHVELQALSELFARPIEVYHYNSEPMNIFQSGQEDEDQIIVNNSDPIRLSYHTPGGLTDSGHYNSVRPVRGKFKTQTALIYTPPQVLETAIRNSESDALEKAMLEDKLRATDWEATSEALEEQVARESYLEWLRENERRRRRSGSNGGGRHSPLTTSSSTITNSTEPGSGSPKAGGSRSPNAYANESNSNCRQWQSFENSHVFSCSTSTTSQGQQKSPHLPYYLEELPEGPEAEREILARVLLASRQEYLESLKSCKKTSTSPMGCKRDSTPPPTAGADA